MDDVASGDVMIRRRVEPLQMRFGLAMYVHQPVDTVHVPPGYNTWTRSEGRGL